MDMIILLKTQQDKPKELDIKKIEIVENMKQKKQNKRAIVKLDF
jgi:hypothetical protein